MACCGIHDRGAAAREHRAKVFEQTAAANQKSGGALFLAYQKSLAHLYGPNALAGDESSEGKLFSPHGVVIQLVRRLG